MKSLALYTTMYPGGESFWHPFLESVSAQTDGDFTLWIGVDTLDPAAVRELAGRYVTAPVQLSTQGDTPVGIRRHALQEIVERHEAVVLVDSDDVLMPDRVQAARSAAADADLAGCALELIDEEGGPLDGTFGPPVSDVAPYLLPYVNVFGFSNTVYRSSTLRNCLPATDDVELLDWHVATKAWLFGARLAFDPEPRMRYRHYGENIAGVLGPFTAERIRRDIRRVLCHYEVLLGSDLSGAIPARREAVLSANQQLTEYWNLAGRQPELLDAHARSLTFLSPVPMWWEWVTALVLARYAES